MVTLAFRLGSHGTEVNDVDEIQEVKEGSAAAHILPPHYS